MGKHILSLDIPITRNATILPIKDTSLYEPGLGVNCERLEIVSPGYTCSPKLEISKGFATNFTACDLGLQNQKCDTEKWLIPDGIYHIRYSVSPNDQVFVEYYHLRTINTLNLYYDCMGNLDLCGDNVPQKSIQKLEQLRILKLYLDNAKTKVEDYHELAEGIEMFQMVVKKLRKICGPNCGCC